MHIRLGFKTRGELYTDAAEVQNYHFLLDSYLLDLVIVDLVHRVICRLALKKSKNAWLGLLCLLQRYQTDT